MLAFPESADDRIQRALNDAKRNELSDKFGGVFIGGDMPLPAEIESEFLQRIEEFELKWAAHDVTTVRDFIGDPPVKFPGDMSPEELHVELSYLMTALEENDIELDFAQRPSDAEVYRFIVEELLDHEMDDIRVPGMVCHFLYEEFHPNDEMEARYAAEWFFDRLLTSTDIASFDDRTPETEMLRQNIVDFRSRIATIIHHEMASTACTVEGSKSTVTIALQWSGLEVGTMNEVSAEGDATVTLLKSALGDWQVMSASLPGGW